jgi:hypothetical protein
MDRRTLLGSLSLSLAGLAGCGGRLDLALDPGGDPPTPTGTPPPTPTSVSLPYTGADSASGAGIEARGVRVANDSGRSRFVTVVVTTTGGRELLVASRAVADSATARFPRIVARRGTYRVLVETADGRRLDREWRVTDVRGDFEAVLDRGVSAFQHATCAPDCPPLSTGGDLATYATGEGRGTLFVTNRRDEPAPLEVRLASDYRTVLEYGYEVPPDVRIAVPAVGWGEPGYVVSVAYPDGDTDREAWRRADGDRFYAVVEDDGTRFLCDTHFRDLRVRNETTRDREVSVTVLGDGEPIVSRTVDVAAESDVRRTNVVPPANRYGFRLSTADGESTTTEWNICPSRGAIEVVASDDGLWVGVRSMR